MIDILHAIVDGLYRDVGKVYTRDNQIICDLGPNRTWIICNYWDDTGVVDYWDWGAQDFYSVKINGDICDPSNDVKESLEKVVNKLTESRKELDDRH